jgi:hypothetical protein
VEAQTLGTNSCLHSVFKSLVSRKQTLGTNIFLPSAFLLPSDGGM